MTRAPRMSVAERWGLPEDELYVALPRRILRLCCERRLHGGQFFVLVALVDAWNPERGNVLTIGSRDLAQTVPLSQSHVGDILAELATIGLIRYDGGRGVRKTVDLAPLLDAVKALRSTAVFTNKSLRGGGRTDRGEFPVRRELVPGTPGTANGSVPGTPGGVPGTPGGPPGVPGGPPGVPGGFEAKTHTELQSIRIQNAADGTALPKRPSRPPLTSGEQPPAGGDSGLPNDELTASGPEQLAARVDAFNRDRVRKSLPSITTEQFLERDRLETVYRDARSPEPRGSALAALMAFDRSLSPPKAVNGHDAPKRARKRA